MHFLPNVTAMCVPIVSLQPLPENRIKLVTYVSSVSLFTGHFPE